MMMASLIGTAAFTTATGGHAVGWASVSSSPPDRTVSSRPVTASERTLRRAPALPGVFTTDPVLSASSVGGSEPSIAVNPANPNQIAISRFTFRWNNNSDVLYSVDGGITWANEATIPPPPGVGGTAGCPCDQTFDYGRDGRLYGTFLTASSSATTIVTGSTTNITNAASWSWNGNPAQLTSGSRTAADQPWLLVNRDPTIATRDNAYVAYDDFAGGPAARVAVSYGANPVNITADNKAGTENPLATNPGLRLATDPRNGTVYALYEQSTGAGEPKNVTYRLNRSTNGGASWSLNGSNDGLVVDTVNSDQAPGFKFGGVNALLGGVDHAAVDPTNGDVYFVYGQDVAGGNQIKIRRLQDNGVGGLSVGAVHNVSSSTNTALPSVAVLTDGTIGVLYDSFDGNTTAGFPKFSAHLARSTDHGVSFSDVVLESFVSPDLPNPTSPRQRNLGDYQQIKAVGASFFGVFSGNRNGFGSTTSAIDPIFFSTASTTPPQVSIGSAKVFEGDAPAGTRRANFTVTLSHPSASAVTVHYATADGSADSPGDYTATSGTVTFPPGSTSQTVVVFNGNEEDPANAAPAESEKKPPETFTVNLSAPVGATIAHGAGVGKIIDDEPAPVDGPHIDIGHVRLYEGTAGAQGLISVSLSEAVSSTVTVHFTTADGTARVTDSDYTPASGTVTFPPGTTDQTVAVRVHGDTDTEGSEVFTVNLSNPVGAPVTTASGVVKILDGI
jgi:hypothetical protein